jgi:tryptophanyl-tRNA synthetase
MLQKDKNKRVVSGIRATGKIHLGNYHGAIKGWVNLQHQYDCYFFIADLHALTTHYADSADVAANTWELVKDLLAAGLDPQQCKIFLQSNVSAHAELNTILGMITPLSWLERVPTYKDQQEKLHDRNLATYGFLGYPLLQAADILLYKPNYVPVGEDQIHHIELTREIARRFNHIYGNKPEFIAQSEKILQSFGKTLAAEFKQCAVLFQQQGQEQALLLGQNILKSQNLNLEQQELLHGYLKGQGKIYLPEPEVLLTDTPKYPGLDGQKMSKSYHNTILLAEEPEVVKHKINKMPTDPARVKRTDPGDPNKCPVWDFHKIYSDGPTKQWVVEGCTKAKIGCLDCKKPIIDHINKEQQPIRERRKYFDDNPQTLHDIIQQSTQEAKVIANETLKEVREAVGIVTL